MAVISTWVLFFYTSFCGLSAAQATLIFGIARVLDAVASPTIGYISDRFGDTWAGRRFGRRRAFILAAIPLSPSRSCGSRGRASIIICHLCPVRAGLCTRDHSVRDAGRRNGERLPDQGQVRRVAHHVRPDFRDPCRHPAGPVDRASGEDSPDTYFYMGLLFSALFMASATMLYLFSWERPRSAETMALARERMTPLAAIRDLYRNLFSTLRIRAFRLHLGMYLGGYISQDIFNAAFAYFVVFALGGTTLAVSNLAGLTYAVQTLAVLLAINFALRASPARAYQIAGAALRWASCCSSVCGGPAGAPAAGSSFCRSRSRAWGAARSTISPGPPTTTWPMSMRSSPAAAARARLRAS
jgi:oligogalacturonide transporter